MLPLLLSASKRLPALSKANPAGRDKLVAKVLRLPAGVNFINVATDDIRREKIAAAIKGQGWRCEQAAGKVAGFQRQPQC